MHSGTNFYPLNLERIAIACNFGFPLPDSSGLLLARPTHALRTCCVCLLFDFYLPNLDRIAVACSSDFPLPASSGLLLARPTHALRTYYVFLLFDFYPLNLERLLLPAVLTSHCPGLYLILGVKNGDSIRGGV